MQASPSQQLDGRLSCVGLGPERCRLAHTHPSKHACKLPPSPQVKMDPEVFKVSPACEAEMKATRMKKRVFDILSKALAEPKQG